MKLRKLVLACVLALIVGSLGVTKGLAYIRATYGAPCGETTGVTGVLQKLNLLSQGDCQLKKGTTDICRDNGDCTISSPSGTTKGKCRTQPEGCVCVPK